MKSLKLLFLMLFSAFCQAQIGKSELKPFTGFTQTAVQDQLLSLMIYKGNSILMGLEKTKGTKNNLRNFKLDFSKGKLMNSFQNYCLDDHRDIITYFNKKKFNQTL